MNHKSITLWPTPVSRRAKTLFPLSKNIAAVLSLAAAVSAFTLTSLGTGSFVLNICFYNRIVSKSQQHLPMRLLLLEDMSGLNVLLNGTTAAIRGSRVHFSSTFKLEAFFTTASLLPPQVWYEVDWNIIFFRRCADMRCSSRAAQQAR